MAWISVVSTRTIAPVANTSSDDNRWAQRLFFTNYGSVKSLHNYYIIALCLLSSKFTAHHGASDIASVAQGLASERKRQISDTVHICSGGYIAMNPPVNFAVALSRQIFLVGWMQFILNVNHRHWGQSTEEETARNPSL